MPQLSPALRLAMTAEERIELGRLLGPELKRNGV
jgi:hypothetical protein